MRGPYCRWAWEIGDAESGSIIITIGTVIMIINNTTIIIIIIIILVIVIPTRSWWPTEQTLELPTSRATAPSTGRPGRGTLLLSGF